MITFKLEVMMDWDAHSWACKNPHFGEAVESILKNGYSNEYYNTSIYSEFDSLESANVADKRLTNLVTEYEILYKQSLVKEMTIADIERILGHPVKIIK
jgi:hypothetical protein